MVKGKPGQSFEEERERSMSSEENKRLIRHFFAGVNARDMGILGDLMVYRYRL